MILFDFFITFTTYPLFPFFICVYLLLFLITPVLAAAPDNSQHLPILPLYICLYPSLSGILIHIFNFYNCYSHFTNIYIRPFLQVSFNLTPSIYKVIMKTTFLFTPSISFTIFLISFSLIYFSVCLLKVTQALLLAFLQLLYTIILFVYPRYTFRRFSYWHTHILLFTYYCSFLSLSLLSSLQLQT